MKFFIGVFLAVASIFSVVSEAAVDKGNPLTIWSTTAARYNKWSSECYPIGNGRLGAMPFGDIGKEHIQFNEDTLWIGDEKMTGAYQNFGDIFVDFGHDRRKAKNYVRKLDLRWAVQTIRYSYEGVNYTREYFASQADNIIVFRFSADKKGAYNAVISLKDAHRAEPLVENGNTLVLAGNLKGYGFRKEKNYKLFLDYEARMMVLNSGGSLSESNGTLVVKNADSFTLIMTAGTDYLQDHTKGWKGEHPHSRLVKTLATIKNKSYSDLLMGHVKAYRNIFGRLAINLGATAPELLNKPTAERLKAYKAGSSDPDLEELMFQYARYLMIGSSRAGGLPANLQGLWNNSNNPPWRCDFHSDVNLEMNYWFVDMDNLSKCFAPYPAWLKAIHPVRQAETKASFKCRGWLTHGENGPFGGSTWRWSKGDAAWMLQNLWDHYQFTLDRDYLEKDLYPLMKNLCEFWEDNLKELPNGKLVSPNAYSPEHGPDEDGASFDQQLVWNLFDDFQKASKILGRDADFRKKVADMQKHLLGPKIGKWGQLQEWMVDRDNPKDKHRHVSHMIALHPGHQISPRTTPELAKAAAVSMTARGDGSTGWSKAWKLNIWARLHDGNHAYKLLSEFIKNNVYINLFGFHPPFQIDCNFGYASGVSEMLLQSHMGYIEFLPALPDAWPQGYIHGIKARGAFVLNIDWQTGKLSQAEIISEKGARCKIYSPEPLTITSGGRRVKSTRDGNIISFATRKGKTYKVTPAK